MPARPVPGESCPRAPCRGKASRCNTHGRLGENAPCEALGLPRLPLGGGLDSTNVQHDCFKCLCLG
eukprot:11203283-Lingulodinium_polyedra.AAC.1